MVGGDLEPSASSDGPSVTDTATFKDEEAAPDADADVVLSRGATTSTSVSKSIEDACHAAAVEDGTIKQRTTPPPRKKNHARTGPVDHHYSSKPTKAQKSGLRRGKWTTEEENYAHRLIIEFRAGLLPLADGTTLRTFLSKLLNCDPMRISKKFVGSNCIGKQVFKRRPEAELNKLSDDDIEKSRAELAELERQFHERVAQANRCRHSALLGKGNSPRKKVHRKTPPSASFSPTIAPQGRDIGSGIIAPELSRRDQEYLGPDGQTIHGPILSPWMLPPQRCSSSEVRALVSSNGSATDTRATQNVPTLRRSVRNMSSEQLAGLPRTDSQESLPTIGRTVPSQGLGFEDLPRNTSLDDLAGLNMFTHSPFSSHENLASLLANHVANAQNQQHHPVPEGAGKEWQQSDSAGTADVVQPSFFAGANEEGASGPVAALGRPPLAHRSSERLSRLAQTEASTAPATFKHLQSNMPKNTSIDDFLSLVQAGDIPEPPADALSACLFPNHALKNHAKNQAAAPAADSAVSGASVAKAAAAPGHPQKLSDSPRPGSEQEKRVRHEATELGTEEAGQTKVPRVE